MDQNWFYLIEQASDMSKIKLSFIIHACCLNKTTKTINKWTAPWLISMGECDHPQLWGQNFFFLKITMNLILLDRENVN